MSKSREINQLIHSQLRYQPIAKDPDAQGSCWIDMARIRKGVLQFRKVDDATWFDAWPQFELRQGLNLVWAERMTKAEHAQSLIRKR